MIKHSLCVSCAQGWTAAPRPCLCCFPAGAQVAASWHPLWPRSINSITRCASTAWCTPGKATSPCQVRQSLRQRPLRPAKTPASLLGRGWAASAARGCSWPATWWAWLMACRTQTHAAAHAARTQPATCGPSARSRLAASERCRPSAVCFWALEAIVAMTWWLGCAPSAAPLPRLAVGALVVRCWLHGHCCPVFTSPRLAATLLMAAPFSLPAANVSATAGGKLLFGCSALASGAAPKATNAASRPIFLLHILWCRPAALQRDCNPIARQTWLLLVKELCSA